MTLKKKGTLLLLAGFLVFIVACAEQKQKAEERGKVPGNTIQNAQDKADAAAQKMQDRMGQAQDGDSEE